MACGILATLAVLNLIFGLLPVRTPFGTMPTNVGDPVVRFRPNREFSYSLGWNLRLAHYGRINNAGFINGQNYFSSGAGQLLAVIGNSFIEAGMVPYTETLQGRLAQEFNGKIRVYSFGQSGSRLAQYLIFARYAREHYHPSAIIFVVTNNDVLNSLKKNNDSLDGHFVYDQENGELVLTPTYLSEPSRMRTLISSLPLAQYLFFNLDIGAIFIQSRATLINSASAPAPAVTFPSMRKKFEAKQVSTAFLNDLPAYARLPPDRILFIIDGQHRPSDARDYMDSHIFAAEASDRGYEVIDLAPRFRAAWRPGLSFDISDSLPGDDHWNEAGHGMAADAALQSQMIKALRALPKDQKYSRR